MVEYKDIEVWDIIKVDTHLYNNYIWLAKVTKKGERNWMSIGSLCIWITPLEKCFQKEYWIKPREILEIKDSDKYNNIVFSFIKL